jgi:NAD(P)-dependent dehydrogenase (short-subunit alcohol dehydrogenase family)
MSEWAALCERACEQGGEVIAVTLTRAGAQALANDVLSAASGGEIEIFDRDGCPACGPPPGACGGRIDKLFNVAAGRREVEYTPLAEADTVTVRDADGSTRTVALAVA